MKQNVELKAQPKAKATIKQKPATPTKPVSPAKRSSVKKITSAKPATVTKPIKTQPTTLTKALKPQKQVVNTTRTSLALKKAVALKAKRAGKTKPVQDLTASQIRELSKLQKESVRIKHFPNLVKSVIVPPFGPNESDSEDSEGGQKNLGDKFASSLDNFMKQVRSQASVPSKVGQPLESKQQVQAKQTKSQQVKIVKNPSVSSLPLEKQKEYKLLKAKLLKMQKTKRLGATSLHQKKSPLTKPTAAVKA